MSKAMPQYPLVTALEHIRGELATLAGGVQFCEDRGYPWTLASEAGHRDRIVSLLNQHPQLHSGLPRLAQLLDAGETIGDRVGLIDEIDGLVKSLKVSAS